MTILQNAMWFAIDCGIAVAVGLAIIWCLVKFTGKHKVARSEHLIEKVYEALKDLEDYYDLYPKKQREKNLKILRGIAIDLAKLQREAVAENMEKEPKEGMTPEQIDKSVATSCFSKDYKE